MKMSVDRLKTTKRKPVNLYLVPQVYILMNDQVKIVKMTGVVRGSCPLLGAIGINLMFKGMSNRDTRC